MMINAMAPVRSLAILLFASGVHKCHMNYNLPNDDGGNSNGCCHDLVSLSVGLRGSGVDIADHAAIAAAPRTSY